MGCTYSSSLLICTLFVDNHCPPTFGPPENGVCIPQLLLYTHPKTTIYAPIWVCQLLKRNDPQENFIIGVSFSWGSYHTGLQRDKLIYPNDNESIGKGHSLYYLVPRISERETCYITDRCWATLGKRLIGRESASTHISYGVLLTSQGHIGFTHVLLYELKPHFWLPWCGNHKREVLKLCRESESERKG